MLAAGLLLLLALNVDFGRDFTQNYAETSAAGGAADDELAPVVSERSLAELVLAVRWAGRRVGGFECVGDSFAGEDEATVLFSVTSRLLRLSDDVAVHIVDDGRQRVVTASSGTRNPLPIGDLGRNPRNLRRLLTELRDVLEGATRNPAPFASSKS